MTCHVRRLPVRQSPPCGSQSHPPRFLPHPPGSQPRSAPAPASGQTAGHVPPRSSTAVFRLVSPSWRAMAHPVTPPMISTSYSISRSIPPGLFFLQHCFIKNCRMQGAAPSGRSRSVLFLFYRPASSGHRQALPPDSVTDFLNVSCPHKQWHSVARRDITDPGRPSRMIPEAAGIRRFYRTMAGLKA